MHSVQVLHTMHMLPRDYIEENHHEATEHLRCHSLSGGSLDVSQGSIHPNHDMDPNHVRWGW